MRSLSRLSVAKNHNFWANFDSFGGSCTDPLLPMRPNLVCYSRPMVCVCLRNLISIGLFSSCGGEKPQFLPFFELRHLVLSPISSSLRRLNTGAQLQTFPYPAVSKSFLYSNAFMAKSGAQFLTFKSLTNRQTHKQKKLNVFVCPGGG